MSMTTVDDERTFKVSKVTLTGSSDYSTWTKYTSATLLAKDLLHHVSVDPTSLSAARDKVKHGKCFAILYQSLAPVVAAAIPAAFSNIFSPNASGLWEHLKRNYSAVVGNRQAALIQQLFRTSVRESENPLEVLSKLQSAHSQLVAGGEPISDSILAFAMTLALPDSFSAQKQSLCVMT
jgi:hypothetical protein